MSFPAKTVSGNDTQTCNLRNCQVDKYYSASQYFLSQWHVREYHKTTRQHGG
jgi:hypothetical protein